MRRKNRINDGEQVFGAGHGSAETLLEDLVSPDIDYGPLPTLVGYQIRKAHSRLFQTFTAALETVGLAPGQYSALLLIALNPGLSQMALADASGIDGTTMVPITDRFAKAGWVRRLRRPDDRRVYSLEVTSKGSAILEKARPLVEAHERQFVARLNQQERQLIRMLLARVADNGRLTVVRAASSGGSSNPRKAGNKALPSRKKRRAVR